MAAKRITWKPHCVGAFDLNKTKALMKPLLQEEMIMLLTCKGPDAGILKIWYDKEFNIFDWVEEGATGIEDLSSEKIAELISTPSENTNDEWYEGDEFE